MHQSQGPGAQRGIALILVLWVVTLLTIIAIGLTATQRTETQLAGNQIAVARFRALADAAIAYAVMSLMAPPRLAEATGLGDDPPLDTLSWAPDGNPRPFTFDGETVEVAVTNEGSLVDLNVAPRELLRALVLALGEDEDRADAVADAILDWRDEDDLRQANGAEDADYRAEGRRHGAKDAPFDTVAELQQVLGIDQALYQALAPALTVGGRGKVDAEFAPALVQAATQGRTLEEAQADRAEQLAAQADGSAPRPTGRGGPLYRMRVTQTSGGSPGLAMIVLVHLEAAQDPPFRVVWRHYGLRIEVDAQTADSYQ